MTEVKVDSPLVLEPLYVPSKFKVLSNVCLEQLQQSCSLSGWLLMTVPLPLSSSQPFSIQEVLSRFRYFFALCGNYLLFCVM